MAEKSPEAKQQLDEFFTHLNSTGKLYSHYTGQVPTKLYINPELIGKLAKVEGFYQREELKGLVPAHAPIVRYIKLSFGMVMLVDDWEERFYHYD